eukprot:169468-Chlamydomonas_euryale.AAC.3
MRQVFALPRGAATAAPAAAAVLYSSGTAARRREACVPAAPPSPPPPRVRSTPNAEAPPAAWLANASPSSPAVGCGGWHEPCSA